MNRQNRQHWDGTTPTSSQLSPQNPTLSALQQQAHKYRLNLAKPSAVLRLWWQRQKAWRRTWRSKSIVLSRWSQMHWLHISPGATWGVLIYEQKHRLSTQVPFLKPLPLMGIVRTTSIYQPAQPLEMIYPSSLPKAIAAHGNSQHHGVSISQPSPWRLSTQVPFLKPLPLMGIVSTMGYLSASPAPGDYPPKFPS